MRLWGTDCLLRPSRFPPDGGGRGIGNRFLPTRRCSGISRLPGATSGELRKAASDGDPEFFCRAAHDHAKRRAEVSQALRGSTARPNVALRLPFPPLAAMDSIQVAAAAFHDPQLAELGAALRSLVHRMERLCRTALTER